jgi:hypothetical protein
MLVILAGTNSQPLDWWQVIEHLSWIGAIIATLAAVFGIPFAYIQLRLLRGDQKRIAEDLARRPKLEVGFFPIREENGRNIPSTSLEVKPIWSAGKDLSEPITLDIACCNNGNRTAREVLYNISVQEGFHLTDDLTKAQREHIIRSPITGLYVWVQKDEYVHAMDIAAFETTVAVRRGRKTVDYPIEVSYDYGRLKVKLTLAIVGDG